MMKQAILEIMELAKTRVTMSMRLSPPSRAGFYLTMIKQTVLVAAKLAGGGARRMERILRAS